MAISSEQYKMALFQQCRRICRVREENQRCTYYDLVYKVLEHDGVTVDADGYEAFRQSTEGYLNYLSDSGFLTANDVHGDSNFVAKWDQYWGAAFGAIGITATSSKDDYGATFTFIFPDGVTESYDIEGQDGAYANNYVEPNVRINTTLDYAKQIMPFWNIQPSEDTIPLNEISGNRASFVTNWEEGGLYWSFDSDKKEIEFTGEGALKMTPSNFTSNSIGLGLGTIDTAIYGAGVTGLPVGAFNWGAAGTSRTIVCLHGASDEVTLAGSLASVGSSSSAYTLDIYCDNETIRAGTFGSYVTVNWHSLSEWAG